VIDPVILPTELVIASRAFGAGIFLLAVHGKLRNWLPFVGIVGNYRLLPEGSERLAAVAIVSAESAVAVLLATGFGAQLGALFGIALLLGFAGAMATAMARGQRMIDCGCFQSSLRQRLSGALIVRNLVLASLMLPALATASSIWNAAQLVDGIGAAVVLLALNSAVAAMISNRDANARLNKRLA
jgi:hypothetical protein